MRTTSPSPIPVLLTAGALAVGLALLSLGVLSGVQERLFEPRPAMAGLLVAVVATVLGALFLFLPASRSARGSLAVGTAVLLGLAGFVFGPSSLFVVAAVPILGLVVDTHLGLGWSRITFATGVVVGGGLYLLGWLGTVPLAPAFQGATTEGPLLAVQAGVLFFLAALVQHPAPQREHEPPLAEIDTVVPAPPRTTRTGTFSLEELRMFDTHRPTPGVGDDGLEVQKLESLGVLAGGVAHDFNNLLMSILGNTSLALTDTPKEHPAHEPLREIEIASKRARDLVGQLLAYAGKGGAVPSPVDLNALVREMGDLLQTAMKARARVSYQLCSGTSVVMADPTQLRQVVMNLITNAGDAMKGRNGEVVVSSKLRRVEAEELRTTLLGAECEAGPYVVLEVADEGCGMDAATLERIFDPFYTTKRTGRGLGLAAVLGIVRRYGGTMTVESRLDEGTTFRLYLPYADTVDEEEDFATENTATARGWSPDRAGSVLLVDDDPVVRMVTQRMLQRVGFEVIEAIDGFEAIARIEENPQVRVAVVDMTMPGMTGLETLTALRERVADLPVVLVSGYSEDEVPPLTDGVFLQKPYTLKQLTRSLDTVLESRT